MKPLVEKGNAKYELVETNGTFCVWEPMIQMISCKMGIDDVINNFMVNLFGYAFISIIASCITVVKLLSGNTKVHGRKSVVTIILLAVSSSFMYLAAPIGALMLRNFDDYNQDVSTSVEFYQKRDVKYEITFFMIITYLPQITSVLNPIILITRGTQLQDFIRQSLGVATRAEMKKKAKDKVVKIKCNEMYYSPEPVENTPGEITPSSRRAFANGLNGDHSSSSC